MRPVVHNFSGRKGWRNSGICKVCRIHDPKSAIYHTTGHFSTLPNSPEVWTSRSRILVFAPPCTLVAPSPTTDA